MSRVQPKLLPKYELDELLEEFWLMIASLETKEEVKSFFRDLLSETETVMFARRIRIAKLLLRGRTYQEIQETLHTSEGTIAGVHRWLQSGFGGYKNSLPRLEDELKKLVEKRKKRTAQHTPYTFEWLKKRYPLHFLLFNILDTIKEREPRKKRLS